MNPGAEKGYALDFVSVIRHVATELDRAAPAALSVGAMAATYRHTVSPDLTRVREHHGLQDDQTAVLFLVERAAVALGDQIAGDFAGYRLARPFAELQYDGRRISRMEDPAPWTGGRGVLDPMTDRLGGILDRTDKLADEELRWSLQAFGWLPELPRVVDTRGAVLVGNRRTRLATELGLPEPFPTRVVDLAAGDAGEAQGLTLAMASNLGTAKMTKQNRVKIARHLYGEEGWMQERIAEALKVSVSQISEDVRGVSSPGNSKKSRGGRPRTKMTPAEQAEAVRRMDAGDSAARMAPDFPVGRDAIQRHLNEVKAKREAVAVPPPPAPEQVVACTCPHCGHTHTR